jgi:hypothetical protein
LLQFSWSQSVWWPYIQSVINMDFINGCTNVISWICSVYLFNDWLTCKLMLLSCWPGMYWTWVCAELLCEANITKHVTCMSVIIGELIVILHLLVVVQNMLVCLYVSAHKKSSPYTDFHRNFYWGVYWNLLMFQYNNNWHITEDLCEFLSARIALFGQEIVLHKSCRVEWSTCFMSCVFLCNPNSFWYS